jgi:outer membrane protein TolC
MRRIAVAVASILALAACSLAPPYERPATPAPASFKESPAAEATWFPAAYWFSVILYERE